MRMNNKRLRMLVSTVFDAMKLAEQIEHEAISSALRQVMFALDEEREERKRMYEKSHVRDYWIQQVGVDIARSRLADLIDEHTNDD